MKDCVALQNERLYRIVEQDTFLPSQAVQIKINVHTVMGIKHITTVNVAFIYADVQI